MALSSLSVRGQGVWSGCMDRRGFLMGAAAFALPVPSNNALAFKVLRNGTPIGEHHLSFSQTGDDLAVTINVALLVRFAGIPVFRYALQAVETWSGGRFSSLHSMINDNGTQLEVEAHQVPGGYLVTDMNHNNPSKSYPQYLAPPDTMPLTYWNKAMMYGNILNIQTAHSYRVNVASPGWNRLPTADGGTLVAQRFDLTGKLRLSVWYDQDNAWSGLAFQLSGDETYEKIV
jgi:hypothetical protein